MGMCIFQAHFPLCWTHWSTQAETPVPCSCEQKLIGPGMTQAVVHTRLDLNYVSLEHVYLTTVSSVGTVWEVHAYINENSETKITDKCFWKKKIFLHSIHTKNVLTTV